MRCPSKFGRFQLQGARLPAASFPCHTVPPPGDLRPRSNPWCTGLLPNPEAQGDVFSQVKASSPTSIVYLRLGNSPSQRFHHGARQLQQCTAYPHVAQEDSTRGLATRSTEISSVRLLTVVWSNVKTDKKSVTGQIKSQWSSRFK